MKHDENSTRENLVAATVKLLDTVSLEEINATMVLAATGSSKSSLYHFFEDFSDLLEHAFLARFEASVRASDVAIKEIIQRSQSVEDFYDALDQITQMSQERNRSAIRFERARALARSERSDRFRQALGVIQQQLTDSLTEAFAMAQAKGFLNTSFEPRTGAVLIQAYTLGRIVDDITTTHMNDQDWNQLISRIMRLALGKTE